MSGNIHVAIAYGHQTYGICGKEIPFVQYLMLSAGPVFRVSPNELSFASVASWKDIYGHQPAGKPAIVKSEFYEMYGAGFRSLCIGSERNPSKHQHMRKSLSSAFSTKALSEQESIVAKNIDAFIIKLGQLGGPKTGGLDMSKWYEMSAFDILGDMAFGESFHCIQNGMARNESAEGYSDMEYEKNLISGRN